MGNVGSIRVSSRRSGGNQRSRQPPPPTQQQQQPQPEIRTHEYVFAAAAPHPTQNPNPNPIPVPLPAPNEQQQRMGRAHANPARRHGPAPCVEYQNAVIIRNDVNIKKETLRIEPDEANPGKYLVAFTFDATVAGSITIIFFAKEGENCYLSPTKENLLQPVTVHFREGLAQEFHQPSGTGIDLSMYMKEPLSKEGETDVHPLAVKAEALPENSDGSTKENPKLGSGSVNSQVTLAVFEKDKCEYRVRVGKQILWVNGTRYELQEIYGIGNSVESVFDGNDLGKECVICLSEPGDTIVLPCRHMCMCSGCAKVLRFQTNRCPICRQPIERLVEIKVNNVGKE